MARLAICFVILAAALSKAQDNAQKRIPDSLRECFQEPQLLNRDSRLPMTMNMLIDLIRKVEETPNGSNMDIRTITISLIHKFKQDGIIRSPLISPSSHTLPYSPTGFQFDKHRLLLTRLLPGNALLFPNSSISSIEKCSIHHMLSSVIAEEARGDEGLVCNRLSQYKTLRIPREIRRHPKDLNFDKPEDVEVLDPATLFESMNGNLVFNMTPTVDNAGDRGVEVIPGVLYESRNTQVVSQCPVEDGVVYTQWGAVSAGTVLAGIAAGLEQQSIPLRNLIGTNLSLVIDNRFAATIAGDLAEVAIRQGPVGTSSTVSVGSSGGWNSTQAPRWYFLTQSTNNEMTDAEIRGGLDGLILALSIENIRRAASTVRLSQVLDMYYSQRGVFSQTLRACNRKALLTEVAPAATLTAQAVAFTLYLDNEMQHPATVDDDGLEEYATAAVNALNSYIPSNLNDLSCAASVTSASSGSLPRPATDLFIVLDTAWNFNEIYPSLSYLLDNLDVSRYGTNVTLLNARNGAVMVNSTANLATFHEFYNITVHQSVPTGFDLPQVLVSLRQLTTLRMDNARLSGWVGGSSTTVLFMLSTSTMNDADITYAVEQKRIFYEQVPDFYFLYAGIGNRERFNQLVRDTTDDTFAITLTSGTENSATQINPIIERIQRLPLRVVNPWCGSNWQSETIGTKALDGYVEPQGTVYYRLMPNYFYRSTNSRVVRIQGAGFGTLNVCHSRTPLISRLNDNQPQGTCTEVVSNTVEINLQNFCDGHDYINACPPLFISVTAAASTETTQTFRCTENACRYPDMLRFTITTVELGCFSDSSSMIASFTLVLLAVFTSINS